VDFRSLRVSVGFLFGVAIVAAFDRYR